MKKYIFKRLLHGVAVTWVVVTLIFLIVRMIPGDVVHIMLGANAPPSAVEALRAQLGLGKPLHIQYYNWLLQLLQGNLGMSIIRDIPVLELLVDVAEPTVSIAILAMIIGIAIGIPTGILSAIHKNEWSDYVSTFLAFLSLSMPKFWIGIVLVVILSNYAILPVFGYSSISAGIVPWFKHVIAPALAVGIPYGGVIMRMTRSSMLEVMNEEYIRNARAKGLSPNVIIVKHGLQNALLPVVTVAGILLGGVLGGVVAVELVFGISGVGRLLIGSIEVRDYPVVQGAVILVSIIFVGVNLSIDILYTYINPKVRYGGGE